MVPKTARRRSMMWAYSSAAAPDKFIAIRCDKKSVTVDQSAYGEQELRVTLHGRRNAPIAVGVAKLRFTFHNTESADPESMYREIDVFGSATACTRTTFERNEAGHAARK